jgi:hypothetical protein
LCLLQLLLVAQCGSQAIWFGHHLFLFDIAAALLLASALLDAPHARSASANLVGSPFFSIGPGMLPILARKLARRGLSPALTGAFNVPPVSAL